MPQICLEIAFNLKGLLEEEGRASPPPPSRIRNSKAGLSASDSEGLVNTEEEEQRSVREGFLEEVGLKGRGGSWSCEEIEVRAFWAEGCWADMACAQALRGPGCLEQRDQRWEGYGPEGQGQPVSQSLGDMCIPQRAKQL